MRILLILSLLITGCGKKTAIEGARYDVLSAKPDIAINHKIAGPKFENGIKALSLKKLWGKGLDRSKIFVNTQRFNKILCDEKHAFIITPKGYVLCFNKFSGKLLWKKSIRSRKSKQPFIGAGAILYNDFVFVCSPDGEVLCLDVIDKGNIVWRYNTTYPMRATPAIHNNKIIATSINGRTFCLNADSGELNWTYQNNFEGPIIINGAVPVIKHNFVIVSCASGTIFALNLHNGHLLWSTNLYDKVSSQSSYNLVKHVSTKPIIMDKTIIFIGYGGITKGFDLRSGNVLWTAPIGGKYTPISHNNKYVFILTEDNVVVALHKNGSIKWIKQLPDYSKKRKKFYNWSGPTKYQNLLFFTSSHGKVIALDGQDGKIMLQKNLGSRMNTPCTISDDMVFTISDYSILSAYKIEH